MIFVCLLYVVACLPDRMYYFLVNLGVNLPLSGSTYYITTFVAFLYICTNPFIYAIKFDPVRRVLLRLISCKKNAVGPAKSDGTPGARTATVRNTQEPNRQILQEHAHS